MTKGVFLCHEAISQKQKVDKCDRDTSFDIFLIVDKYLKNKPSVLFTTKNNSLFLDIKQS